MFKGLKKKMAGTVVLLAAVSILSIKDVPAMEQVVLDGVMGQSLREESINQSAMDTLNRLISQKLAKSATTKRLGASPYDELFTNATFEMDSSYTSKTYYHDNKYENYVLLNGIDVSWWQGGGRDSTITKVNWEKAHDDGIDFAFVRVASRDTADGSIYTDTCADAHIRAAQEQDINIGLYIFSQALNEEEAVEEAQYVLDLIDEYGWDIYLPIVIDREAGSYKRLTSGKLTREQETNICLAFTEEIQDAGYQSMAYASLNWVNAYWDTARLEEAGCGIWLARYNDTTTSYNLNKNTSKPLAYPFEDVKFSHEFWQYASTGRVDGYAGNIDVDIWYKNTDVKTENLIMNGNTTDSISLHWQPVSDADGYRLYRYDEEQDKFVLVTDVEENYYVDESLMAGEIYEYKVRCYWSIGGTKYYGRYSDVTEAVTMPDAVELIETMKITDNSITFAWDEVYGASGYRIYRKAENSNKYKKIFDIPAGDITEYKITELEGAKEYSFKVKAYLNFADIVYWADASETYTEATKPVQVTDFLASTESATKIYLEWLEDENATGYQIYRKEQGADSFKRIADIDDSTQCDYTDINLPSASLYEYKVRAYYTFGEKNYYGKSSLVSHAVTKPDKAPAPTVKAKKGKMIITFEPMDKVSGYVIYRREKGKKFAELTTLSAEEVLKYTDKTVEKGKAYTYKIRAFIEDEGQIYYGGYSPLVEMLAK